MKNFNQFLTEKLNFDAAVKYLNSLSAKFKFKTLLDKNYAIQDIFTKIEQNKGLGQEQGLIFKNEIRGKEVIGFYVVCQDNGLIKRVLDDVKTNWNTFSDSQTTATGKAPSTGGWNNTGSWGAKESKIYEEIDPTATPSTPAATTPAPPPTTSGTTQQKPIGTSTTEADKTSILTCSYNAKTGKCAKEGEGLTKDQAKFDQLKQARQQQGATLFFIKYVMMW